MNLVSFRRALHFAFAWVIISSVSLRGSESITDQDATEIKALSSALAQDLGTAKLSNYPKYFAPASLEKLADEYRHMISWLIDHHPDDVTKMVTLTPDAQTIVSEKDPAKFFAGIALTPAMIRQVIAFGHDVHVVAVTGTRAKAYAVMEGKIDGIAGVTRPHSSAWLFVPTQEGWRLEGSNLIRSVRRNLERLRQTYATDS